MDKPELLNIIIAGFILLLIILVYEAIHAPEQKIKKTTKWMLLTSKAQLIRSVISFTGPILAEQHIDRFPSLKIYYHSHTQWAGYFCENNDMIYIYVRNNHSVDELVNTVLHELAHYIQCQTNPHWFSNYDYYQQAYGYHQNPLEVDSRLFAQKWMKPCLRFLQENNFIAQA